MINIVIITHGDLSSSLISSASLINNHSCSMVNCGLFHGDDIAEFEEKVRKIIIKQFELSNGDGVLILTDLFGGSPSNVVAKIMHELSDLKIECVTGVNLPIVLQSTIKIENESLEELTEMLVQTGKDSIINLRKKYCM